MFENYSESDRPMLQSSYNVITTMEKWSFLKEYEPPLDKGFMWDDNETVIEIMTEINNDYSYHSGSSLAYVMRIMKTIAKSNE